MRILHYIHTDERCADFAERCRSVQLCCMDGPADISFASSLKEFRELAKSARPNIVHIHGCWSVTAWRITRWCRKNRIPFVISTHRLMEPWHIAENYITCKLPMMALFQKNIISEAKAIHATTEQEQCNIMSIGYGRKFRNKNPWNKNVVTIRHRNNPAFCEELARLYNKVIDSNPFTDMDKNEIMATNALMFRGFSQDQEMRELPVEYIRIIKGLPRHSWRKILLHANDEGITELIEKGAAGLCQDIKEIPVGNIERFDYKNIKNRSSLKSDVPHTKPLRLEEIGEEEKASENEIRICTLLLNLKYEIRHGSVSRRHIADVYTALRFTDYNEDKVVRMLSRLRIKKFTGRILQIISEMLWLEEGFSPMETINDKGTDKIRKKLLKTYI